MKLKKLEIFGFKSFPESTELLFDDGITAIVGPNGCGKSNVIDAIRWVMGETSAKGLRGDSMEDVIFSGSDTRKALGLAEVVLTLSEVEGQLPERFGNYDEVAITRRLHRSGESEYLINKVPCRLKDITELFMDTGVGRRAYSVVEQGRIDAILAAKPRDRRVLIEEAAGITKYKSRKDETLRKMEHTRQNLDRVGDVIREVRREMNALQRQAGRARAFKTLRARRKELERHLMVGSWLELAGQLQAARSDLEALEKGAVAARTACDGHGARVEQGRLRVLEEERTLEARQRQVYDLRGQISQRDSRVEFLRQDAEARADRSRKSASEREELEARAADLRTEIDGLTADLEAVRQRIAARAATADTVRQEHGAAQQRQAEVERAVETEKRELMTVLGELARVTHAHEHARRQAADGTRRLEGMARQRAEMLQKLQDLDVEIGRRREEHDRADGARAASVEDRARLEAVLQETRTRHRELTGAVESLRRALATDESRLRGLEEIRDSLEWYGTGVKTILRDAKNQGRDGFCGVVADTLSVPARYEAALEAALGEKLQYVIVADAERGLEGVRHLKSRGAGRSSFAPVDLRQAAAPVFPDGAEEWAHGPLLELVAVAPEYQGVAQGLLGDVFVVETLEHAVEVWQRNGIQATLVTLEGETVSPAGVISGGTAGSEGQGLLRKNREIRELRKSVADQAAVLEEREASLAQVAAEVADLGARLEQARDEAHRWELQALHIKRELAALEERRDRLDERRESMEFEHDELAAGIREFEGTAATLERQRGELLERQQAAEQQIEALSADLEQARQQARDLHERLTRQQVEEATDRQRREGLEERVRSLEVSLANVGRRVESLGREAEESEELRRERVDELHRLKRENEVLRTELERQEQTASELARGLAERRTELTEQEAAAAAARRRLDEVQGRLNEAGLQVRDLELRAAALVERFAERVGGELEAEAAAGLPEDFVAAAAQDKVRDLAHKIDNFGEINLLAIEEYEKRKERFEFLEEQRQDLEQSLASLKQAISRINRVSRERFAEAFDQVSERFTAVYPRLFRGGEARLVLTDPEDLLESGIEIIARPPGKRPQQISLLSGGEKALTAVALIFSIFMVKPSPFCILDEVDAPLDEANIGRFTEILGGMAQTSQFLIITHSKSTMEFADHLYGVTMGEPGVSKVVSVHLGDAPRERAA